MAQKVREAINSCKSFKPLPYDKAKPQVDYDEAEPLREATREYNEI